jgi:hypothetical protein
MQIKMLAPLLLAALVALPALPAGEALACGNSMRHQKVVSLNGVLEGPAPPASVVVLRARKLADGGDHRGAIRALTSVYPELMKLDTAYKRPQRFKPGKKVPYPGRDGAGLQHAARIAALSLVRSQGKIKLDENASIQRVTERQRKRQLEWALGVWRHAVAQDATRSDWRNHLGEALCAQPKTRAEGLALFEALEAEDLLLEHSAALLKHWRGVAQEAEPLK